MAHALVALARSRARSYMRLRVALRGRHADEGAFGSLLIEDQVGGAMSYIAFLCHVHKRICDDLRK